jgi:hypothetical protein
MLSSVASPRRQAGDRSSVVSSFTIIKGAFVEETYAILASWDETRTKRQNLDELREHNRIGASSATWLRDLAKVLNRRLDPAGRDRALVVLAKGSCPLEEWKPILLWHITRDEFLVRDFLQGWLFDAYDSGAFRVRPDDLHDYLRTLSPRGGVTEHDWSEATLARVATGLLRLAAEFGLMQGSVAKEFRSYHLPERSFLYILHALRDAHVGPGRIVAAPDWRMFLMRPGDVEQELLHLHQFQKLRYQVAGSLVELALPSPTALEYAERMAA